MGFQIRYGVNVVNHMSRSFVSSGGPFKFRMLVDDMTIRMSVIQTSESGGLNVNFSSTGRGRGWNRFRIK